MRPEFDSQIDSVLRGHARRGGATPVAWDAGARPSNSDVAAQGTHLDADEIAAFGEDALPAAARARYSAHLADCDDCRRNVTQVALAAGVADRFEERGVAAAFAGGSTSAAAQSPSWRERLSAAFAPRAWRYAMPVVALLAVSAVVLVVTRGLRPEDAMRTAQKRDNASQGAAANVAPEMHHGGAAQPQQTNAPVGTLSGNTDAAGTAPATGEAAGPGDAEEVAKIRPKAVDGTDQAAGGAAVMRPEVAAPIQAAPASQPTQTYAEVTAATPIPPTPPPMPAAAPLPQVWRDVTQLPATPAPTPADADATSERARDDPRAAQPRDEAPATKRHGPQRSMSGRAAELSSAAEASKENRAARARARGPQKNEANNRNEPEESKDKRENDRERQQAETRAVAGRRFRREGNVWVDTAYRAGQATVVVRAGSEQYRALVADEPEIGRISRAFGSEVVVVWKGRAYRVKP